MTGTFAGDEAIPAVGPSRQMGTHQATPLVEGTIALSELGSALSKRWRLIGGCSLAFACVSLAVSLLISPTFTAVTTFVPDVGGRNRLSTLSALAGLAGQVGVPLTAEAVQSPRFYAAVATSRELVQRVLLSKYRDPRPEAAPGDSTTLVTLLGVGGDDLADSLNNGVRLLRRRLAVAVDNPTGIVRLSVESFSPPLAAEVANRFVDYLNDFNAQSRQSRARERRKFVEERVTDAEQELRRAEEGVKTFYERNRSWQQSPYLAFEEGRLRRQVDIRQEVYLTLKREFETARIEEVNDTPVITVIDKAIPPTRKSKPRRILVTSLALVLGAFVGVAWTLSAELANRAHRERAEVS